VPHAISQALAVNDLPTATRLAHTLKGLAGNIAASEVVRTAATMEQALHSRAGENVRSALLDALASALATQIAAIHKALPQDTSHAASAQSVAADTQQFMGLCKQLETLLRNDDGHAERLFKEHAALFRVAFAPHFVALQAAVNAFDSERALAVLQEAMAVQPVEGV
jgi:HPt (histidine-containing phosphotransfer) domain-containing protein